MGKSEARPNEMPLLAWRNRSTLVKSFSIKNYQSAGRAADRFNCNILTIGRDIRQIYWNTTFANKFLPQLVVGYVGALCITEGAIAFIHIG